jgi:hypothetical protein
MRCRYGSSMTSDSIRLLRHLVATIAYRASRSLRDAPSGYADTRATDASMSAIELVRHMTNVLGFALASVTRAERVRHEPLAWKEEVERFYAVLRALDDGLAECPPLDPEDESAIVQGPLADVLTHIGQLHALRRLVGAPVSPEAYTRADIRIGRVGLDDQAPPGTIRR